MVAHGEMAVASEEYLVETAFASRPFVLFHELVVVEVPPSYRWALAEGKKSKSPRSDVVSSFIMICQVCQSLVYVASDLSAKIRISFLLC